MAFEEDLRSYLEELGRGSRNAAPTYIDDRELYRHLLKRLREMESAGAAARVERLFIEWPGKLVQLARHLEAAPGLQGSADAQEQLSFAFRTLDAALDCLDPQVSLVDRLEAERAFAGFVSGLGLVEGYALENHLVRLREYKSASLTELGRVLLRLRGKDAVRWLMTAEVAQSGGGRDPWHVPRTLLEEATTPDGIPMNALQEESEFRYSGQTLHRLRRLRVLLEDWAEGPRYAYRVTPEMQDVVQAVLEAGPWHTAVRALLEDERALVLPGSPSGATEATIEQTKLIVHEVRNALIPVRHDVDALRTFAAEHAQLERIHAAKQGIARVLDFVEAMAQMSELITEPAVRCEISAVVDEAVGWIDTGGRVERAATAHPVHVVAPRIRFARAISNVVGNALQATAWTQPVRVSIGTTPGAVRVIVDDGGPGVPTEHRVRVFQEGVTMRPDGSGSGFGLAFARRVVEDALHGKIWCEDSDLGGARFVIEVPEASPG